MVFIKQNASLLLDRWIGFEGVAAVSSFKGLDWVLMWDAVKEPVSSGSDGIFQVISKSPFAGKNEASKSGFLFGSEPGIIGFSFFAGNFIFTIAFIFVLVRLIIFIERLTFYLLDKNEYFTIFFGLVMANVMMQFTSPIMTIKFFIEICITVMIMVLYNFLNKRVKN